VAGKRECPALCETSPTPQPKMTTVHPFFAPTPNVPEKEEKKMTVYRVFSGDLKTYFDVSDGLAEKDTEEQSMYCLEIEDAGVGRTTFAIRWRFIEDRCDAPDSITKGKRFQRLCREWTTIGGISSSSSFAANMDDWLEVDEE
jgi:hypothetical protein